MATLLENANRIKTSKEGIKEKVNQDFTIINDEKIDEYPNLINNAINEYKEYIPRVREGSEIVVADGTDRKILEFNLLGKSTQATTTGKNKLAYSLEEIKSTNTAGTWNNNVYTYNGVTFTINDDLSIEIGGTFNDRAYLYLQPSSRSAIDKGTYTLSGTPKGGSISSYMMIMGINDGTEGKSNVLDIGNGNTLDTTSYTNPTIRTYIDIRSSAGINKTFYPMLRLSSISDSTYEPYTGGQASPNPDYPQEIKNDIGIENLFDISQLVIGSVANGQIVTNILYRVASNYIDVKPNTNYIFKAYDIGSFKGIRIGVHELNNGTFIKDNGWHEIKNNTYSLKTSSTTNKIIFVGSFSETSETVTSGGTEYTGVLNLEQVKEFLKFKIEEGKVEHDYVPYGHCLKVYVKGNNLLKLKDGTYTSNGITLTISDNILTLNGTNNGTESVFSTIKSSITVPTTSKTKIKAFQFDGTCTNVSNSFFRSYVNWSNGVNLNFTTSTIKNLNANLIYNNFIIGIQSGTFNNYQFGILIADDLTDSTIYEPYKLNLITVDLQGNELCSIGDVKDELVIENGKTKIVKRIGKIVFNGSENDIVLQSINSYGIANFGLSHVKTLSGICISDRFIKQFDIIDDTKVEGIYWQTEYVYFRIKSSIASTIDEFKAWLSTNNVIVYYLLETAQEIELEGTYNIELSSGTNKITNSDSAYMKVNYYKEWNI